MSERLLKAILERVSKIEAQQDLVILQNKDNHSHLLTIIKNQKQIMTDLTALEAEVAETKTVVESAVVLIDGLRQAIIDAGTDPVKLKALTDSLDAENKKLADKVAENTAAEEETP